MARIDKLLVRGSEHLPKEGDRLTTGTLGLEIIDLFNG